MRTIRDNTGLLLKRYNNKLGKRDITVQALKALHKTQTMVQPAVAQSGVRMAKDLSEKIGRVRILRAGT